MFCDSKGWLDLNAVGVSADGMGVGLKSVLAQESDSARRMLAAFARRKIVLGKASSTHVFGTENRPGSRSEFLVRHDGVFLVAVPSDVMMPD